MKVPPDLVPQKVVADDLCVSLATLWRARRSNLPGFPAPVIVRNMVFWRKADLGKLEDALMQFQGRGKFEQERQRTKRIAAMAKTQPKRIKRARRPDERQRDLF
ncbi:MAG: hypothetical protein KJZ75_15485 [Hyphomonadaceae bacterium]|nr:hypothetical protein [Hyphomonadaceae bacterium]GIK48853.1 MAG: hypothetical protein BroJett013_15500 [Alphaproteobacteria bacterium]